MIRVIRRTLSSPSSHFCKGCDSRIECRIPSNAVFHRIPDSMNLADGFREPGTIKPAETAQFDRPVR